MIVLSKSLQQGDRRAGIHLTPDAWLQGLGTLHRGWTQPPDLTRLRVPRAWDQSRSRGSESGGPRLQASFTLLGLEPLPEPEGSEALPGFVFSER